MSGPRLLAPALGGGVMVILGAVLLATRDPQAFFDPQTITAIVLLGIGGVALAIFNPLRRPRARIGKPISWTGPAVVIGLLGAVALMVFLLFIMDPRR